jgi:hypothetical protein
VYGKAKQSCWSLLCRNVSATKAFESKDTFLLIVILEKQAVCGEIWQTMVDNDVAESELKLFFMP